MGGEGVARCATTICATIAKFKAMMLAAADALLSERLGREARAGLRRELWKAARNDERAKLTRWIVPSDFDECHKHGND
jgi:hypothetical protein